MNNPKYFFLKYIYCSDKYYLESKIHFLIDIHQMTAINIKVTSQKKNISEHFLIFLFQKESHFSL